MIIRRLDSIRGRTLAEVKAEVRRDTIAKAAQVAFDAAMRSGCTADYIAEEIRQAVLAMEVANG